MSGNNNAFIVIDLEHIALGRGKVGQIIQVGIVKMDGVTGKVLDRDEWFVKSGATLTDLTTEITGITQEQADSGLPLIKVTKLIKNKYGTNFTYYGWGSDCATLNQHSIKQKGCTPIKHMVDFQHLYQTFVKSSGAIGLRKAMADNGLEFEGKHHTAADDAYNTGRLIHLVMSRGVQHSTPTSQL